MAIEDKRNSIDKLLAERDFASCLNLCNELFLEKQFEPTFSDWFNKGLCHFHNQQHEEAVKCYSEASAIDPENFQAITNRAISLMHLNRYEEAFKYYREALTICPNIGPAWLNVGFYHMDQSGVKEGALGKAVNAFRKAVEIVPDFASHKVYFHGEDVIAAISYILDRMSEVEEMKFDDILSIGEEPGDGGNTNKEFPSISFHNNLYCPHCGTHLFGWENDEEPIVGKCSHLVIFSSTHIGGDFLDYIRPELAIKVYEKLYQVEDHEVQEDDDEDYLSKQDFNKIINGELEPGSEFSERMSYFFYAGLANGHPELFSKTTMIFYYDYSYYGVIYIVVDDGE